jgi:uncharacterized protein (DUF2336 family)
MNGLDIEHFTQMAQSSKPEERIELAGAIAAFLVEGNGAPKEIADVTAIALRLADDVVFAVREALAGELVKSPRTPVAIVFAQIGDSPKIACPYLQYSPVLLDGDLANIAAIADEIRLEAIIEREPTGPKTARAIIDHAPRHLCAQMLVKPDVPLDDAAFHACIARHGRSVRMRGILLEREDLPITLKAHLVSLLSEQLCRVATERHWLSGARAQAITDIARERSLVRLARSTGANELAELVSKLQSRGKLTGSIILRAACIGSMSFVAEALSHLARVPVERVLGFMRTRSNFGLSGIIERAGLEDVSIRTILIALEVYQDLIAPGVHGGRSLAEALEDEERFGQRMIERILTQLEKVDLFERSQLLDVLVRYGSDNSAKLAVKLVSAMQEAA